jgi:hypothetical protein
MRQRAKTVANACSTLGDVAFAARWEAGKALPLEDIYSVVPNAAQFAGTPPQVPRPHVSLMAEASEGKSNGVHASPPPAGGMRTD